MGLLQAWSRLIPAFAREGTGRRAELRVGGDRVGELSIVRRPLEILGRRGSAVTINGTVPGPLLRFREGETVTLRVTNYLEETTSVHWHGVLVPSEMDGVPGISFPGIAPGATYTYRYTVRQSGTYWYHSHSAFQEQLGLYAPLVIDPADPDPVEYDREHVVMFSDWTFERPERIFAKLKKESDFFNFQQRTAPDFFCDARRYGARAATADRLMWADMRMSPADILDITGYAYTYLVNGMPPALNWTGLFQPGERVRLRFINGSASTFFNVRIPGLSMTVVQADGQNVQPVVVEEFQMGVAETYDVIVHPQEERAYTVFAEAIDRSGFARGTLAPREGMSAAVPALRKRPLRSMADMGMDMSAMDMSAMDKSAMDKSAMGHGAMKMDSAADDAQSMPPMHHGSGHTNAPHDGHTMSQDESDPRSMEHGAQMPGMRHGNAGTGTAGNSSPSMPGMQHGDGCGGEMTPMRGMESPIVARHGPDHHGPGNAMVAEVQRDRLGEPGIGLEDVGHRVLTYKDLRSLEPARGPREPTREVEMHLTGNMQLFMWSIDGKKFSEAPEPVRVRTGERVRVTLVNDTMMEHPMHLHGVFMELVNGAGAHHPRKHTIIVKPAERLSFDVTYDEPGNFAFHCHFLYHMEAGMFRFFNVSGPALWRRG